MATSDRGFASMDPAKQREIASKGGKASGTSRGVNKAIGTNSRGTSSASSVKRGGQSNKRAQQ